VTTAATTIVRFPPPASDVATSRDVAFSDFLASVVAGLMNAGRVPTRIQIERALQALVPATVRVVERGTSARLPDAIAFAVPPLAAGSPVTIEALPDAGRDFDDADLRLLEGAAYVAALAMAIERGRRLTAITAWPTSVRRERDARLVGSSAMMCALRERIERVASADCPVLIEGESGSGKELVARQLHEQSPRRQGPFVAVNCAALVESLLEAELFGIEDRTATGVRGRRGKIEHADGGTLFLDEVSDLTLSAQAKLLRAIQDLAVERVGGNGVRHVDARVIVATNRSLTQLMEQQRFRVDLYYRINGVEIQLPPLRSRREDIPELVQYFLERLQPVESLRLTPAALDALLTYDWPGNVRELQRVIERAVVLAKAADIGVDDLPPAVAAEYTAVLQPSVTHSETIKAWARRYARLMLERCGGNRRQACARLGISYHTLRVYLREMRDAGRESCTPSEGT
jgi:DNA-binding NtrC family response regulator